MKTTIKISRYDYEDLNNLGFIRPITNSEIQQIACNRSYTFEYIECIKSENINENFAYGSCWHSLLEHILNKVKKTDKMPKLESIKNFIFEKSQELIIDEYFSSQPVEEYDSSVIQEMKLSILDRMYHSIDGWYDNWIKNIHSEYKVIDVEKALYYPITHEGETLVQEISLAKEEYEDRIEYRHTYTGEIAHYLKHNESPYKKQDSLSFEIIKKSMPFYKIGKADVILLHRERKDLWILDHKTTRSVSSYDLKTNFNLQLIGYCSLLRDMVDKGLYSEYGEVQVGGIIWDLCASDISSSKIPKKLKSGGISKTTSKATPYWLYEKAIKDYSLDLEKYQETLDYMKSMSEKFFLVKVEGVSNAEMDRVKVEDFVYASRVNGIRKFISLTDFDKDMDWDLRSSRFTICNSFGSCKYSKKCFANIRPNDIYNLSREQKISWTTTK